MLDRILNINPQDKYKSGLKIQPSHFYTVNRNDKDKHNSKDSALFSPLAKLLSKINWRILNIDYPNNEEMFFNFLVDDLEFSTTINFSEMYTELYQKFSIKWKNNNDINEYDHLVELKVEKEEVSTLSRPDPIITEAISILFNRISEQNLHNNFQTTNSTVLTELINGIGFSLNAELNYILKVIYTFISTRHSGRVKNNINLKTQKNIPIIMQKVAINVAE